MIVTRGAVLSVICVMSAPCIRVFAYSSAFRYPVDSVAIALVPTIIRAYSMILNIWAMPLWVSPTSHPTAGVPCWPNVSSHVADALSPILCSRPVTKTPLRSPGSPVFGVGQVLGNQEQAQSLGSRARTFGTREHQVHDVLEHVVGVAVGDEPLDAVDMPGAVGLLDRLGAACADIRAGVGFGQDHGGGPIAFDRKGCQMLLLLVADVEQDVRHDRARHVEEHRRVVRQAVIR